MENQCFGQTHMFSNMKINVLVTQILQTIEIHRFGNPGRTKSYKYKGFATFVVHWLPVSRSVVVRWRDCSGL